MDTAPKKRGRKALDPAAKRSEKHLVALTPTEAALVAGAAERAGEPVSTWSRRVLVRAAKRA